jgi:DNA-binding LacI/PurR family transcriptional regulator
LSVTGFDGLALAPAFRVGLTTLSIPVAEMVQCTFRLIEQQPRTFRHQLNVPLIERESHGPPPANRK